MRQMNDISAATLNDILIAEGDLHAARMAIFHSSGAGYVVFRNFLDGAQLRHMRSFWLDFDVAASGFLPFSGKAAFRPECPNFVSKDDAGNCVYHNFLWNPPVDELTWSAAWAVHGIRSRISGRSFFAETLPHGGRAVSARVTISRQSQEWIPQHRDYMNHDRRFEKNQFDFSRIQATLILSKAGVDYRGEGFRFQRNDGAEVDLAVAENLAPGDLVLWRYNNLHSVGSVEMLPGGSGFMRILFPLEEMHAAPEIAPSSRSFLARLAANLFGKA